MCAVVHVSIQDSLNVSIRIGINRYNKTNQRIREDGRDGEMDGWMDVVRNF